MKKLELIFNSLEDREKYVLSFALIFVIFFVGIFFITIPYYKKVEKLQTKLDKEIKNYNQLLNIAGKYASYKKIKTEKIFSISDIDKIAGNTGIKENILLIKPTTFEGKEVFEIKLADVSPRDLQLFINNLKKHKINIFFIKIENPRENNKLKVRITVG